MEQPAIAPTLYGLKVLLADAEPRVRRGLAQALAAINGVGEVLEAGNAVQALAVVRQSRPDIVVVDLMLPGGNSLQMLRGLAASGAAPQLVVLSHVVDEVVRQYCLGAGATAVLDKDGAIDALPSLIRQLALQPARRS